MEDRMFILFMSWFSGRLHHDPLLECQFYILPLDSKIYDLRYEQQVMIFQKKGMQPDQHDDKAGEVFSSHALRFTRRIYASNHICCFKHDSQYNNIWSTLCTIFRKHKPCGSMFILCQFLDSSKKLQQDLSRKKKYSLLQDLSVLWNDKS